MIIDKSLPHVQSSFTPDMSKFLPAIFVLGFCTLCALALVALVAVAYLLNLTVSVFFEVAAHLQVLYSSSDNLIKLLFIALVAFILYRFMKALKRKKNHEQ